MNRNAVILFTNTPATDAERKINSTKPVIISLAKECYQESILHLSKKIKDKNYTLLFSSPEVSLFDYVNVDSAKRIFQRGNSFGERFYDSINEVFKKGFNKAVIIGNDTTVIKKKNLAKALKSAGTGKVCVGPSTNGGFYLLSISKKDFQKVPKHRFISLSYQAETVFAELINLLNETLLTVKFLAKKKYFNCTNELLVVQQFKKVLILIRSGITQNVFMLLSTRFIRNIFVVTHSLAYQQSFHKAPPFE